VTKHENDPTPIHGGFALAHFNGDPALEAQIKNDLGVTVRCIPLAAETLASAAAQRTEELGASSVETDTSIYNAEPGTCPFTGQPSKQRVIWAKSY